MFALLEQAFQFEASGDVAGGLGRSRPVWADEARRHRGRAILEPAISEEAVGPHPVSIGRLARDVPGDPVQDGLERHIAFALQPIQLGEGDRTLDPVRVGLPEPLSEIGRPCARRIERFL